MENSLSSDAELLAVTLSEAGSTRVARVIGMIADATATESRESVQYRALETFRATHERLRQAEWVDALADALQLALMQERADDMQAHAGASDAPARARTRRPLADLSDPHNPVACVIRTWIARALAPDEHR
jgi:hypothetical protein